MSLARHELLSDISAHTSQVLREHGIDSDVAEQAGDAVANQLAENWGGQQFTFPRDYFFRIAKRDLKIYEEFRGNNYAELARKHHMTARGLYKLIARVQKRLVAERQGDLFGGEIG
ncbi:DNA-binding protein [Cupriavidus metallidurans]|uniref:DNA-binding protein n=2 Tax=Cupriavidus metallidurans TaxID=119219 RepID=A0A482IUV8_9BURK|nr:DNA-binding protein [Cupriavidus metallidurans]